MSSLKKLRDDLVAKGGYSITPQHRQLNDLKDLLNDMVTVRSGPPPAVNDDQHNSGIKCVANAPQTYTGKISLSDLKDALNNIRTETCPAVQDATCGCVGRTGCACNTNTDACQCNTRSLVCACNTQTYTCSCNNRTATCSCNSYTSSCDCNSRTASCSCNSNTFNCTCNTRSTTCSCNQYVMPCQCNTRTTTCTCVSRTGVSCYVTGIPDQQGSYTCGSRDYSDTSYSYGCGSRDYSDSSGSYGCGSRDQTDTTCGSRTQSCGTVIAGCICNGRCACNTERRFE